MAFPALLLVLFFAVVFGVGATGAVLAVGVAGAPMFGRLCQTLVAGVAGRDFVLAARIAGVGRFRILLRHVLPNIAEPLVVNATIGAGGALLTFAGLSFLGLGVQDRSSYDWGRLMQDGLGRIYVDPLAALGPGIAVVLAGLAFNLSGEAVARRFGVPSDLVLGPAHRLARRRPATAPAGVEQPAPGREPGVVLDLRDLHVGFPGSQPVRGVSLRVREREAVGIVGESGSGKSLTALAVAGLVEPPGTVEAERVELLGTDVRGRSAATDRLLGTSLALVFQDPMTSFNPVHRMGSQLAEVSRRHHGLGRRAAAARAVDRLRAVRIGDPERRARQYPFEFSGGMRQRAMIGMGLMGSPALIVADEPTTALDVTVQQQVLSLLQEVREREGAALVLISHDVTVVAEVCERVVVMYGGRVVEELPATELHDGARHPYTRALVAAVPDMETDVEQPLATIPGRPVDPRTVTTGCAYAARCPLADGRCRTEEPALDHAGSDHRVACWHAGEALLPVPQVPAPATAAAADPVATDPVATGPAEVRR
ncbi:dipeptide/oligopeptide/nickel ABC transporter permease/ATP-binding protein [Nocardioides sp. TF02-7]|uniref:dipeptide/oligopeptide/nickel ABC transporter permease/ATP-binding protein n=1 Tax=Nocardioides sp. TF02-7 TaxID=2917724 RepID=UPI001F0684E6|nr:dipeptide/oligopeptide/nickel ABC transporter permease/ATP-binding protein [Nocardioides sp. TF02-7]UMG93225.1 dipeptide/oligopeptide/nickel ABC transporter permease/ATP-binding protein [Nocardioides sp. TF02-7]